MPSVSLAAITTTLLQVTPGDSLRTTNEPTSVERMSVAVLWLIVTAWDALETVRVARVFSTGIPLSTTTEEMV